MNLFWAKVLEELLVLVCVGWNVRPWIQQLHAKRDRKPSQQHEPPVARSRFPNTASHATPVAAGCILQHQKAKRSDGQPQPEHESEQPGAQEKLPFEESAQQGQKA